MCGIASIYNYKSRDYVRRETLNRMNDCMIKRGPDGEGIWIDDNGSIGLAHRRLSIIDLSEKGAQPMHFSNSNLSISFNGEIYNYKTLRKDLEKKGRRFKSHTDTEVLLHLYDEMGRDMVHKLRGMFAFAIWDGDNERLFLARDQYGIKPLYYSDDGKSFKAASQVKALLQAEDVNTSPKPAGHVGFFLWGTIPEPYTLFKGIKSLPAGNYMCVEKGKKIQKTEYASLRKVLSTASPKANQNDYEPLQEHLRTVLLDSIRHHLVADVDVGVFLSAGLDSTTITALSSEFKDRLRTVTLGFEQYKGSTNDETILAEKVSDSYQTKQFTAWVDKQDFLSEKENLFQSMDQPTIDGVNTYFVSKITAEAGLKVALSGIGGDELFGGYSSFNQIPKLVGWIKRLPGNGFGTLFRKISAPLIRKIASPKYAGLFEWGDSIEGAYLLRRGLFMPWELDEVLEPGLAEQGLIELKIAENLKLFTENVEGDHAKITALESSMYMRNQLLRDADWAGMAHSLEIRVPLVDWQLLKELAPYLNNKEFNKQSMAKTAKNSLPNSILDRPKTGFSIPVCDWLMDNQNMEENRRGFRRWAEFVYNQYHKSCKLTA